MGRIPRKRTLCLVDPGTMARVYVADNLKKEMYGACIDGRRKMKLI